MALYYHLHAAQEAACIISLFNSVSFLLCLIAGAKNNLGVFFLLCNPQIGHFGKFKGHFYNNKINNREFKGPYMCTFLIFNLIFILYWSIVDLKCCVSLGVQQSESVIHIHISILFQILSRIGYYRILSRVPCAIL